MTLDEVTADITDWGAITGELERFREGGTSRVESDTANCETGDITFTAYATA